MAFQLNQSNDELAETHEINVTPFIDVMLVLLIIFMVAAPLATVDINVDLPASTAETTSRPDTPIYLTLKSDLSIALGDSLISRENIKQHLDNVTKNDSTARIFYVLTKPLRTAT